MCVNCILNLLEKIEFRLVCFRVNKMYPLNKKCPFLEFIEVVIIDQANEITELRACGGMLTVDCHKPWWLIFGNFYPFNQPLWFPTLKILKIPWNRDIATKLISSAPKLEKITGCLRGSWSFEQMGMKGKEYAMTNRTVNGMNEIQVLTTTIKPKLEKVILKPQPTEEEYHCVENNLYMFSHMICRYLRRLDCSISTLYLLANGPGMPQFPLKTLRLCNDLDMIFQESVSSLRSVEFERSFPNVEKVALSSYHEAGPPTVRTFCPPKQDFQSYSVTMLTISFKFLEQQPIVISNVFPNVKVLRLSTTSSNSSLSLLPHVLVINPEWKDLEKIDLLHGNSVEDLQLDSIFRYICDRRLSKDKGTGNHLHKLNTLSIYCKPQDGTYYSHLINANSYLISKDIAELIATKLPGFTIEFKVVLKYQFPRMDYLLGLNFDHIRPYAKIRKTIVNGGDFSKHTLHIWSFEF